MTIDFHAHYYPTKYIDFMQRLGSQAANGAKELRAGEEQKELDLRFQLMDAANVHKQILSMGAVTPYFEDKDQAVEAAKMANDLYADIVSRYPDRLAAFAQIPLPHIDAAIAELGRALDDLNMIGVVITTTVLGHALADPMFEPLYAELDRRGAILCIHPAGDGARSPLITSYGLTWSLGAPVEDVIAATQLIMSSIPVRYPRMKILNPHLGGALPMLMQRLDNQYKRSVPDLPELPSVQARRMWYDTVSHYYPPALRCANEALGADKLVVGTDFPYLTGESYKRSVTYITESSLSESDVHRILETSGEALFTSL